MNTNLDHGQNHRYKTVHYMSDTKDEQKPMQLIEALVRNERLMALQAAATNQLVSQQRVALPTISLSPADRTPGRYLAADVHRLAAKHGLLQSRLVRARVLQKVLVVGLRAHVEAAGEERGGHADLGYEVRRLAQQQRDDAKQHQLCGQTQFSPGEADGRTARRRRLLPQQEVSGLQLQKLIWL